MNELAANLRRLMARFDLTANMLAERSGLDVRTIKGILSGSIARPHARTIHRLASALEVDVDEFFQTAGSLAFRHFDRETNPVVAEVVADHPELVRGWAAEDFDQLYGRFGVGGALNHDGALEAIRCINQKRAVIEKVDLLLETDEAELLTTLVEELYRRVVVAEPAAQRCDVAGEAQRPVS